MKIFFNRVPRQEPYGGGNQFLYSLVKKLETEGHEVVYHLQDDIDLIFMMDPRPGDIGYSVQHIAAYKSQNPQTKVLHRVNECDKRKGTSGLDELLLKSMSFSSSVVFISEWLKEYFCELGFTGKSNVIYNGCNTDHFYPKLDGQLGSTIKLVTHHWSDNWMKGFDIYTDLDKYLSENRESRIEFTYIGRYYKAYTPSSTKIIDPTMGKDLGTKIREHDIYVTASRFEPCGMHHIEGSASGLPVLYHSDGGGINEFCKNHGYEYKNFEDFLEKLDRLVKNYNSIKDQIDYQKMDINYCIDQYIKVIKEMF